MLETEVVDDIEGRNCPSVRTQASRLGFRELASHASIRQIWPNKVPNCLLASMRLLLNVEERPGSLYVVNSDYRVLHRNALSL